MHDSDETQTNPGPDVSAPDVPEQLRMLIVRHINDAVVHVESGGGGHYTLIVVSATFAGKSSLERQRAVMRAIALLLQGDAPPVHAIDHLVTRAP